MGAFCPNLSNRAVRKDFNRLLDMVGEDLAYYLWDKYEGEMSLALKEALDITVSAALPTQESTEVLDTVSSVNKRREHFTPEEWSLSNRISTILSQLFPEISKEFVDSIENGNVGKIDLDALKVMIDVSNERIDTLPHEYAHYYIAMFRDSELVKEGIELFGSEEQLVQAMGMRTVEMEGKARTWWLKLTDFIKNLLNINKLYKELLLAELTDAFLNNKEIGDRLSVTGIRYQSKDLSISEVLDIIHTNQNTFTYDRFTHTYRSIATGRELKAVSVYKDEFKYNEGYDSANEDSLLREITKEALDNGNEIHAVFEHMWKGTFKPLNHPKLTKLALDNIQKIVDSMKQEWDFVASEVRIADEEHDIAGTTDLLLRNKKTGKYNLFDYKSKLFSYNGQKKNKRGGKLWGFTYVDSRKYSTKNQRDAYDFQLSAYQKMLGKLGIEIENRYIIPIVYSTNNGKIDNAFVSKIFGSTKEVKSNYIKIDKNKLTTYDVDYKIFGDKEALGVDSETVDQAMFEITDLVRKVIEKLNIQKEILKLRRRRFTQERDASRALEEISSLSELDALLHYVNYAADQVLRLNNQVIKRYKQGSKAVWDLDVLLNYKELASSYDIVSRISGLAHRYEDLFGTDNVRAIDSASNRLQAAQRNIIEAYNSIGSNLYIEAITPYIGNVRYNMQQEARAKYIKDNPRKAGETSKDFESRVLAYVDQYTIEHEQEIAYKTKEWLRNQSQLADSGFECSSIFAAIGSVYESKDPFIQASVQLFDKRMNEKERKLIAFKSKMQRILKEYRSKYNLGNFSNLREVFDDFIEVTDDGVSYLISPVSAEYRRAEKKAFDEIDENNELSYKEKLDARKAWLDIHQPIYDKAAYNDELNQGIQELMQPLTKEQQKIIEDNLKAPKDKQVSWYKLRKEGKLPDEAVESILELLFELDKKYRKPNPTMYKNSKYEAMMKLKDSNDPKYQLYQLFVDAINDADIYMPNALRLNYRLPGVIKRGCELIGSDGLMAALERSASSDVIVMPDDAIRGTFIDENGDRLKQIPMFYHYSPKITPETQSYDLPTIFFKWYDLALQYRLKKQIEAVLLLTQAVLHTRKTSESNIKSLLSGKKDHSIGSYKKNTSELYDKWIDQVLYGNRVSDMGTIKIPFTDKLIDIAKLIKSIISYSSNRTMGLNTISGINNLLVGESNQFEEVLAGQFVDKESYARATKVFVMNIPSMLEDFNRVVPQNKINQLAEWFGIFGSGDNMLLSGFLRHSPSTYGHLTSRTGEEILQTRFLLAMLMKLDAKDKDGNVIGKMYDFISFDENNQLVVDERVSNFKEKDLDAFSLKARRVLIGLHGNYDKSRNPVAIDPKWYGLAGLSLRRWIEPNFERRFGSSGYDNLSDAIRGGFYRSGFGWVVATNPYSSAVINFIARHCKVADEYLIKAVRWDELSTIDKQNVARFAVEFSIAALAYAIFALLGGANGDDDDALTSNLRYQMYRLFTDLTFFTLPTSFSKILNDPFPVMGLMNDSTKVFLQLFDIDAVYENGRHLFNNKFINQVFRLIPGFKQIGRMSNVSSEMEVFMRLM